jgi:hypothetical protein
MPTIGFSQPSGLNIYCLVENTDGDVLTTGTTFVEFDSSDWTDYDQTATERSTTGRYFITLSDSLPSGTYYIIPYIREGATAALTDPADDAFSYSWSGTEATDTATILADMQDQLEELQDTVDGLGADGAGDGIYPVDHNGGTGAGGLSMDFYIPWDEETSVESSTDVLRYTLYNASSGFDGLTLTVYDASEYDQGTRIPKGRTTTRADGRWAGPINLNSGDYYLVAERAGDDYSAHKILIEVP